MWDTYFRSNGLKKANFKTIWYNKHIINQHQGNDISAGGYLLLCYYCGLGCQTCTLQFFHAVLIIFLSMQLGISCYSLLWPSEIPRLIYGTSTNLLFFWHHLTWVNVISICLLAVLVCSVSANPRKAQGWRMWVQINGFNSHLHRLPLFIFFTATHINIMKETTGIIWDI